MPKAIKPTKPAAMKPEKLEFFRYMLTQKINELLGEAGKTVSEMTSGVKENYPDPNDRASLESDRNFELRIRDRERKLILKMREAIKRMDEGVFGICEVCGGPISEKRLMARPVTTLCINCKMKQEKLEKLKGGWHAPSRNPGWFPKQPFGPSPSPFFPEVGRVHSDALVSAGIISFEDRTDVRQGCHTDPLRRSVYLCRSRGLGFRCGPWETGLGSFRTQKNDRLDRRNSPRGRK